MEEAQVCAQACHFHVSKLFFGRIGLNPSKEKFEMRIMMLRHTPVRDYDPEAEDRISAMLQSYASAGTTLEFHYPEDLGGVAALHKIRKAKALSGLHHMLETPALVKKILEAERSGFDAVVQTDTFDPGVEAGRLAVRIPVVGMFRSSCHFAACLCDRFAIIVPLESYIPYVWRMLETYRMRHFVTAMKPVGLYEPGNLSNYHDLLLERIVALCREFVASGAQAILPLAARLIPYAVSSEEVEREVGVPVINTGRVGIRFAELMVSGKMSHSEKAYPWASGLDPQDIE